MFVDSSVFNQNYDYIEVNSTHKYHCTVFEITLSGGAYDFIQNREGIAGFIPYKNTFILFSGDYPNTIVKIKNSISKEEAETVISLRYPDDFKRYIKDKNSVAPRIYDYENLVLSFKGDSLVYKSSIGFNYGLVDEILKDSCNCLPPRK